ncbi:PP2C family protein-serine/threonine phosphatase [Prauserella muralis]|uniref:Serine/threonine protein phosphatase n=1 Tax=Prauserella muralis TaxID=588067 RepID=A0A2V4AMM5_9PSEU|nr:SpoIIE family protein phosphatase [Prauserella muralis]PXY21234.1 serine/threonine protein phosphatase [Prauserella muralis]TWE30344.1 serine phosphatase RsbU (regulator of sigma subunit) [Prauserella muralis]
MNRDPKPKDDLTTEVRRILHGRDLPPEAWPEVAASLDSEGERRPLARVLRALTDVVLEHERELRWHQSELEQTNAGLLALHAEIDRQRRRTAFLDDVSRAAATSLDGAELLDEVAALLRDNEFADRILGWLAAGDDLACPAEPRLRPDATTRAARDTRQAVTDGAHRVSLPLVTGPHVLGVLDLHRDTAEFTEDDVNLAKGVANRAAIGVRNAKEYEREHELAQRLQLAMLPTLTPYEGLEVVARYRSATRGVHVGGDWYDAVARPDGTVVLTVGDVTGHGLDAALVMGKLQNALRAYALEGHGPASALRLVHQVLRGWQTDLFATAIVAEVETATGVLRWASAGHPPPLLQESSGAVSFLEAAHAPMLGVGVDPHIPEHERKLEAGSSIAFYTDGLIERRSSDLDAGMERLATACRTCGLPELDARAEHVLHELLGNTDHDDDVCLLLCRWAGEAGR